MFLGSNPGHSKYGIAFADELHQFICSEHTKLMPGFWEIHGLMISQSSDQVHNELPKEIAHHGSHNHTKHDLAVEAMATDGVSAGVTHLLAVRRMFSEIQSLPSFYEEGITSCPASSTSAQACFRPACHPAAGLGCSPAAEPALLASSARSHRKCSARFTKGLAYLGLLLKAHRRRTQVEKPASISTGFRCHMVPQLPSCLSGCYVHVGTRY